MIKIYYNGNDVFSNLAPTPLVELDEQPIQYGSRWGIRESITLQGLLTGQCLDADDLGLNDYLGAPFYDYLGARIYVDPASVGEGGGFPAFYNRDLLLLQGFNENFHNLSIIDDAAEVHVGTRGWRYLFENPDLTLDVDDATNFQTGEYYMILGIPELSGDIVRELKDKGADYLVFDYSGALDDTYDDQFHVVSCNTGSSLIWSKDIIVENIEFAESKYVGSVPFTINAFTYDHSEWFSGTYGVVDPVNEFSFEENDDRTVTIKHTVAARGFHTNGYNTNAFQNARDYVTGLTGWSEQISPLYLLNPQQIVSTTSQEQQNRLEATCSVVNTYLYDVRNILPSGTNTVLKYTCDYNQEKDRATVSIKGSLQGNVNGDINYVRNQYSNVNWYNAANNCYTSFGSGVLINNIQNGQITEQVNQNAINFNLTYTDDPFAIDDVKITNILTVDDNFDNNNHCVTLRSRFEANNRKCKEVGWQEVKEAYGNFDVYDYTTGKYNEYGYSENLYTYPDSKSYSQNKQDKVIDSTYKFCRPNTNETECLEDFDYTVSIQPSIQRYSESPILDGSGNYVVQDLGFEGRARGAIQGRAKVSECCDFSRGYNILRARLNELSSQYFVGTRKVLETDVLATGEGSDRLIDFSVAWSYQGTNPTPQNLR